MWTFDVTKCDSVKFVYLVPNASNVLMRTPYRLHLVSQFAMHHALHDKSIPNPIYVQRTPYSLHPVIAPKNENVTRKWKKWYAAVARRIINAHSSIAVTTNYFVDEFDIFNGRCLWIVNGLFSFGWSIWCVCCIMSHARPPLTIWNARRVGIQYLRFECRTSREVVAYIQATK